MKNTSSCRNDNNLSMQPIKLNHYSNFPFSKNNLKQKIQRKEEKKSERKKMAEISPFTFWTNGVILTTISTFGLVGTLMSIVVLLKPR